MHTALTNASEGIRLLVLECTRDCIARIWGFDPLTFYMLAASSCLYNLPIPDE